MILGHYLLLLLTLPCLLVDLRDLLPHCFFLFFLFSLFFSSSHLLLLQGFSPVQSRAMRALGRKSRTNHKPRQAASESTPASYRVNRREQKKQAGKDSEPASQGAMRGQGGRGGSAKASMGAVSRWADGQPAQSSAVSDNLPLTAQLSPLAGASPGGHLHQLRNRAISSA